METLPFELLQCICEHLPDIRDRIFLFSVNRNFRQIVHTGEIFTKLEENRHLTEEVLSQEKFHALSSLDLRGNSVVESVNGLKNLTALNVSGGACTVSQAGIMECLKLRKLNANGNFRITAVNHLPELRELMACWGSGISQEGIADCLRLKRLGASCNPRITSANHLPELEELDASGYNSGISQEGIMKCLRLKRLDASWNPRIISVNHLPELEDLNAARYQSGISQEGIMDCRKLRKLNLSGNSNITSVNHLTELEELDLSYGSPICQEGIMGCLRLRILAIGNNFGPISIKYLTELEELRTYGQKCQVSQWEVRNSPKLKLLHINGNPYLS